MLAVKGTKETDPAVTLLKNGVPVDWKDPKEGIEIEVTPESVNFKLKSAKKTDTGAWEMNLTNTGGSAAAPFDLEVKDRPMPPEGPLEISEICAEGCKLKWKKPKDDGGAPVQGYIAEMQEGRSGNWVKLAEVRPPHGSDPTLMVRQTDGRRCLAHPEIANPRHHVDPWWVTWVRCGCTCSYVDPRNSMVDLWWYVH